MINELFQGKPAFGHRGFMLDISRDRVPTMATLDWLIAILGRLRFTELQLYVEHTFEYLGHEQVWSEASPLTTVEVGRLSQTCARNGLELVAHVNAFGHMQRWLKHEPYRSWAECPGGAPHPFGGRGTVPATCLAPTPQNAAFAVGLATEMLAATGGHRIHIGGDEPFELGDGHSAAQVATDGRDAVYVEHMKRIIEPLIDQGHEVLFWGDLFRRNATLLAEIPAGATGVVWNYEAPGHADDSPWSPELREKLGVPDDDHLGFEAHTRTFVEAEAPFWVAPGTGTWNSVLGRNRNAAANIADAAVVGSACGAKGFLLTDWGDNGHWQPLVVSLPSLVRGAVAAWTGKSCNADVGPIIDELLGAGVGTGEWIDRLGRLGDNLGATAINASAIFAALVNTGLPTAGTVDVDAVERAAAATRDAVDFFGTSPISGSRGHVITGELVAACHLTTAGLHRLVGADPKVVPSHGLVHEFEAAWLASSRPGGIADSITKLRR